ncbi:MAG: HEAT repeat domain-containing protein [Planctomycetota bacterium]
MRSLRLSVPVLLALCLFDSAGLAQTYEQKLDAIKEFKRFYRLYKEPEQKVEAIFALEDADCPEAIQALRPVLKSKVPKIRAAAIKVLSGFRESATFSAVLAEMEEMKDRPLRAVLMEVLSRAKRKDLRVLIRSLWDKDGPGKLSFAERFQMARALGRLGGLGYEDILQKLAYDKKFEVQIAALDSIKKSHLADLGSKLVPLIDSPIWQVQVAAIECHGGLRTREAVEPLIQLLKKGGRLKIDASEALFKITARDYGTDYELWNRQWKFLTSIKGFRLPTDAELEKAAESRKKYDALYGKSAGSKQFAGIPTTSTRVVFVIDVSASMNDVVVDREKFRDRNYPSFQRLAIVKSELLRTIDSLDRTTHFNIISFASRVRTWKKWLVPGNINNRASAMSYVKALKPVGTGEGIPFGGGGADGSGKTNTYEALMTAFDLDPAKDFVVTGKTKKRSLKLDTIYFLTDGRPTIGKYVDVEDILREVKKINEVRKIVIHCISIGEFQASFLRRLAANNGGVFVDLGG